MGRISRRNLLKVSGGVGIAALAGCAGNGNGNGGNGNGNGNGSGGGGQTSISVGIPSAGTTTGQASNSFQRVVQEVTDDIRWNNQETGGDPASLRQYEQGNVQACTAGNFIVASAVESVAPFDDRPIEDLPFQAFSISPLHMHVLSVEGSGIQTTDDLIGSDFWALPPQWGLRQQAEAVMESVGIWDELVETDSIVDADTGDVAGLIEENQIEAIIAYGSGFQNLPGWATEVDARADLQLVEFSDEFVDGANDTRGTSHSVIESYGWENQSFNGDDVDIYGADFQFFMGDEISRDVAYELARISHENVENIQEGQPAYLDHSDPDVMASLFFDGLPVHPGTYDFLDDEGVDMSDHTRGEI